jgi:hypothetical protein
LYLCGIDLFNYGYYWEHEIWESLWHACGRLPGVRRHATSAKELFRQMAAELGSTDGPVQGIRFRRVLPIVRGISRGRWNPHRQPAGAGRGYFHLCASACISAVKM